MEMSSAHAVDTEYLVRGAMNTGYQWCSLLIPPAYITYVLARRGRGDLSLNSVLRATWIGGLAGSVASGGAAYVRYAYSNEQFVRSKRIERVYDAEILRRNDHATIGGVLGAVISPAILWKRAAIINVVLGGAGLGGAVGLLVHYGRVLSGDKPPKVEIILPTQE